VNRDSGLLGTDGWSYFETSPDVLYSHESFLEFLKLLEMGAVSFHAKCYV
jgi:hypothetical protein